jgi:hypothetical protein
MAIKRRLFALAGAVLVAVAVVTTAQPAGAYVEYISVKNLSDRCVWITLSHSNGIFGWSNQVGYDLQKNGVRTVFMNQQDVRARAEVRQNADCTGPIVFDNMVGHTNSTNAHQHITASVTGANGVYKINWTEMHD